MSEWWTYRPSDFLLFSARTYWRLFELYNADLWPWQGVALVLGIGLLAATTLRGGERVVRVAFIGLAGCWLWVAWAYHLERYASINWAATWLAAAFALQGLVLLVQAGVGRRRVRERTDLARTVGVALTAYAVLAQPVLGRLVDRPWSQAEVFGLAPDPTVLATLGLLLATEASTAADRAARVLAHLAWPLPLLWCALSGATLWTLQTPHAGVLPLAGLLALGVAWRTRRAATTGPRPRRS